MKEYCPDTHILTKDQVDPIPGWPHYYASRSGDIYSDYKHRGTNWRKLKPAPDKQGYLMVALHKNGKMKTMKVHVLIASTFLGPMPEEYSCIRHLDGVTRNCSIENLVYGTIAQNSNDMFVHGTVVMGEKHLCSKLTTQQVLEIRRAYANGGVTTYSLADQYNVSKSLISRIITFQQWKHLLPTTEVRVIELDVVKQCKRL